MAKSDGKYQCTGKSFPGFALADVLDHYRTLWARIQSIIHSKLEAKEFLVIEGSALLPELVKNLNSSNVFALWLTASEELLRERIYQSSNYSRKTKEEKYHVWRFRSNDQNNNNGE